MEAGGSTQPEIGLLPNVHGSAYLVEAVVECNVIAHSDVEIVNFEVLMEEILEQFQRTVREKKAISKNMASEIGDLFEFGHLAQSDVLQILPLMIGLICAQGDESFQEEILWSINQATTYHRVATHIDWNPLVSCLSTIPDNNKSYVLGFLGLSKKRQYLTLLQTYLCHPHKEISASAKEAIVEINYHWRHLADNSPGDSRAL